MKHWISEYWIITLSKDIVIGKKSISLQLSPTDPQTPCMFLFKTLFWIYYCSVNSELTASSFERMPAGSLSDIRNFFHWDATTLLSLENLETTSLLPLSDTLNHEITNKCPETRKCPTNSPQMSHCCDYEDWTGRQSAALFNIRFSWETETFAALRMHKSSKDLERLESDVKSTF